MRFHNVRLLAPDLQAQREFYTRVLECAVVHEKDADGDLTLTVAGKHRVTFDQAPAGWTGCYHFAFDVPENQFAQAKRWLQARTELLTEITATGEVHDEFFSEDWNAHMVYFTDPAGNILEFVARHSVPRTSDVPFTSGSLLGISELGVATENVPALAQALQERLSLTPYGESSPNFTAMGDEEGLIILVKEGRNWFPTRDRHAKMLPASAVVSCEALGAETASVRFYSDASIPDPTYVFSASRTASSHICFRP